MKNMLLLLMMGLVAIGCDKQKCECKDDIHSSSQIERLYVNIPNAVNELCGNFIISVASKEELDISQQVFSFSKENTDFTEGRDLSDYLHRSGYITSIPVEYSRHEYIFYFPLALFEINGELITKKMNVDIALVDSEGDRSNASGTTYFYRCTEIDSDFNSADCRWPSQIESALWGEFPIGGDCWCP